MMPKRTETRCGTEAWRLVGSIRARGATIRATLLKLAVVGIAFCLCFVSCKSKSANPHPITSQKFFSPAWSPDGTEIACLIERYGDSTSSDLFLSVLDADSGTVKREIRLEVSSLSDLTWTPDAQWLLASAVPGVFKISSDLQRVIQLTSGDFHTSPSFSQSRSLVFFTAHIVDGGGLHSVTLNGDSLTRWSTTETLVYSSRCYPDSSDSLLAVEPVPGITDFIVISSTGDINQLIRLHEGVGLSSLAISSDRRYIAFNEQVQAQLELRILDRETGRFSTLFSGITDRMDFSPAADHVVYPRLNGEIGLWIVDLKSGDQSRLTTGLGE